jgi:hypothetical protein
LATAAFGLAAGGVLGAAVGRTWAGGAAAGPLPTGGAGADVGMLPRVPTSSAGA